MHRWQRGGSKIRPKFYLSSLDRRRGRTNGEEDGDVSRPIVKIRILAGYILFSHPPNRLTLKGFITEAIEPR